MELPLKIGLLLLVALAIVNSVSARRRRRQLPYYLSIKNRDPNICAVQEIVGTGEQFFPKCLKRRVLKLCGRATFIRLQCCPGFEKIGGEAGCTGSTPLENLIEASDNLRLRQFYSHARRGRFRNLLSQNQAYTIFIPSDVAFSDSIRSSGAVKDSSLMYHIVPGRLNFSDFLRTQEYTTMYQDTKIRINKYPNGVATVNCARIIRPNNEASNGIIHIIDQLVKPYDGESVVSILSKDKQKFSLFLNMIRDADMSTELIQSNPLTVFAPTNDAIRKLPTSIRRRLRNKRIMKDFVQHHIVRKMICGDAIVVSCGLTNLNNYRLKVSCRPDGRYVGGSKLIEHDMMAENGIVHAIETVLLPDTVKDMVDLATDMKLDKFLDISDKAGLTDTMRNDEDFTLFAPTNEAFNSLKPDYMAALRTRPQLMKDLVNYHIVKGKVKSDKMVGQQDYTSKMSIKIKVNVYRNGIMVDDAKVIDSDRESGNGVIHTIDKVLIPPEHTLMGLIQSDPKLSQFRQAIETAGLVEPLESDTGQLTVLAPTNDAFDALERTQLNRLMSNPELLKKHLRHHMVDRLMVPCGLLPNTKYNIRSLQGEILPFSRDQDGGMKVFKMPMTRPPNNNAMAVNGILYSVNHFLHCECKPRNDVSRH